MFSSQGRLLLSLYALPQVRFQLRFPSIRSEAGPVDSEPGSTLVLSLASLCHLLGAEKT
jgi:hypothetical protein